MSNQSYKPTVSEISQQLHIEIKAINSNFNELLRTTSTWEKHEAAIKAQYKKLIGTEKQIAWAENIRKEKTEEYLIKKVSSIWDFNAQKRGEKGLGWRFTETEFNNYLVNLGKEYSFLASNNSALIIDNRF